MDELVTWIKPSGMEIRINSNPNNIKAAKDAGWKPKQNKTPAPPSGPVASGAVTTEKNKE